MNALNAVDEMPVGAQESATVSEHRTRPFLWSVRREIWENKSIYVAPAIAAVVAVIGYAIEIIRHPETQLGLNLNGNARMTQSGTVAGPFIMAAMLVVVTSLFAGIFYCLDALCGERRDRSILFWKSLPVSDTTAVLAKMSIPMVVLPVVTFAVLVTAHLLMLLIGSVALPVHGLRLAMLWGQLPLLRLETVLLYGLITMTVWHAPVYGYLLMVSGWAKRATFLWAVLPFVIASSVEQIMFRTPYIARMLAERFWGNFKVAYSGRVQTKISVIPLSDLAPLRYLSSSGLWIGLASAAVLLIVVVRMRRYRQPI